MRVINNYGLFDSLVNHAFVHGVFHGILLRYDGEFHELENSYFLGNYKALKNSEEKLESFLFLLLYDGICVRVYHVESNFDLLLDHFFEQ